MSERVAFVTGASRGIGKVTSIALAEAGFDVAVSARTVEEGEEREHSSTVKASNTKPLPGSLSATAALVEKAGAKALVVAADLLEPASLAEAAAKILATWGRIDVVVHNGRYIGPGHMDRLLDTPIEFIEKQIQANVIAPLILNKLILPGMIERGEGTIVNIVSASGYSDPAKPAGEGGWGLGYGLSKGAFQRVAGILNAEHERDGVKVFNVQPGFIATERMAADMAEFGFSGGEPPEVVASVVRWLATEEEASQYTGQTVEAQFFCHERALLAGWEGPKPNTAEIVYDLSGAALAAHEEMLRRSE